MLPDESRRRLEAIENFSDLGSGIHIAMQDLDIRGAGNLLGSEQSGFIADLGYETYQKILAEAVTELKNDEFADLYADELKRRGILAVRSLLTTAPSNATCMLIFPKPMCRGLRNVCCYTANLIRSRVMTTRWLHSDNVWRTVSARCHPKAKNCCALCRCAPLDANLALNV